MGRAPDVIIVVRHGARLDAADKQWHLTSPTPYDPPLTYGGWTQSRALGARIAALLRSRESDEGIVSTGGESSSQQQSNNKPRRRHKVVIHTSPFLRCVQTAVAISAGIAQKPGKGEASRSNSGRAASVPLIRAPNTMHSSPRVRPTDSPRLEAVSETRPSLNTGAPTEAFSPNKSTLKIDAWLGEWLSPDYFEHITPPPGSTMMVAGAKGDLLRREDTDKLISANDMAPASPIVGVPGMWGSPAIAPLADHSDSDNGPLSTLSSLSRDLPSGPVRRDRTSSLSSAGSSGSGRSLHRSGIKFSSNTKARSMGPYQAPVPSYSIALTDHIPAGYVAHARDKCTDIDFQWDSSRPPQNWGDGGEYGEEWSSMHKRFRKGLQELVSWYTEHTVQLPGHGRWLSNTSEAIEEEAVEDEEEDLVVILVSHGAGCNALIGALTNQPVLIDVGMASLTMAVRRPNPVTSPVANVPTQPRFTRPSRSKSVSDDYEIKLLANTEHLRLNTSANHGIYRSSSTTNGSFRERYTPGASRRESSGIQVGDSTSTLRDTSNSTSTNFGSIRRVASVASNPRHVKDPARKTSIGLWSAPTPPSASGAEEEDPIVLNFNDKPTDDTSEDSDSVAPHEKIVRRSVNEKTNLASQLKRVESKEEDTVAPLTGLWGAPRPPGEAERIRDTHGVKRRWTVTQSGA